MPERIVITGGAGFIGSHLGDRLLRDGYRVRALDSLDPQVHPGSERPAYLDPEVELIVGDVRDRAAVARAMEDVDAVFHLAAAVGVGQSMYEAERYVSVNGVGCAVVAEEAVRRRGSIRKLVVASSMSIYGEGQYRDPESGEAGLAPPLRPEEQLLARRWEVLSPRGTPLTPEPTSETKPLCPGSVYAVSKRDQEELVLTLGAAYGIPSVALRFFNVYGPRQALSNPYTGVAAIFASRLLNGQPPLVFEDGLQTRDFVHVHDVVDGCVGALTSEGADGEAVNLGTGAATSVVGVARAIARELDIDLEPDVTGQYRAGDIRHCVADARKAAERLGFEARIGFAQGIADLVEWVAGQQAVDGVAEAHRLLEERGLAR